MTDPKLLSRTHRVLKKKSSRPYYYRLPSAQEFLIPCQVELDSLRGGHPNGLLSSRDYTTFLRRFCGGRELPEWDCRSMDDFAYLEPSLQRVFVARRCPGNSDLAQEECLLSAITAATSSNGGTTGNVDTNDIWYDGRVEDLCRDLQAVLQTWHISPETNSDVFKVVETDKAAPDLVTGEMVTSEPSLFGTEDGSTVEPSMMHTGTIQIQNAKPSPTTTASNDNDRNGRNPNSSNQKPQSDVDTTDGNHSEEAASHTAKSSFREKSNSSIGAGQGTLGKDTPTFTWAAEALPESISTNRRASGHYPVLILGSGAIVGILLVCAANYVKISPRGRKRPATWFATRSNDDNDDRGNHHDAGCLDGNESIHSDNSYMFGKDSVFEASVMDFMPNITWSLSPRLVVPTSPRGGERMQRVMGRLDALFSILDTKRPPPQTPAENRCDRPTIAAGENILRNESLPSSLHLPSLDVYQQAIKASLINQTFINAEEMEGTSNELEDRSISSLEQERLAARWLTKECSVSKTHSTPVSPLSPYGSSIEEVVHSDNRQHSTPSFPISLPASHIYSSDCPVIHKDEGSGLRRAHNAFDRAMYRRGGLESRSNGKTIMSNDRVDVTGRLTQLTLESPTVSPLHPSPRLSAFMVEGKPWRGGNARRGNIQVSESELDQYRSIESSLAVVSASKSGAATWDALRSSYEEILTPQSRGTSTFSDETPPSTPDGSYPVGRVRNLKHMFEQLSETTGSSDR